MVRNEIKDEISSVFVDELFLTFHRRSYIYSFYLSSYYTHCLCLQDDERIDAELETMLEAGVDEMSWDSVVSFTPA